MRVTMRSAFYASVLALSLLLPGAAVAQQSSDLGAEVEKLRRDVENLKRTQAQTLKVLREIQKQLKERPRGRRQAPTFNGAEIALTQAAGVRGAADAPVTIVEFSDYQCPFCKRFSANTLPRLLKDFIKAGKLRHVFMDFPIERIHPQAVEAAVAARCAGRQEKYWPMHDRIFDEQKLLKARDWTALAAPLGLDNAAFEACMAEPELTKMVKANIESGRAAGVTGTPAFFLGRQVKDGKLAATQMIRGARPYAAFKRNIEKLLAVKAEPAAKKDLRRIP